MGAGTTIGGGSTIGQGTAEGVLPVVVVGITTCVNIAQSPRRPRSKFLFQPRVLSAAFPIEANGAAGVRASRQLHFLASHADFAATRRFLCWHGSKPSRFLGGHAAPFLCGHFPQSRLSPRRSSEKRGEAKFVEPLPVQRQMSTAVGAFSATQLDAADGRLATVTLPLRVHVQCPLAIIHRRAIPTLALGTTAAPPASSTPDAPRGASALPQSPRPRRRPVAGAARGSGAWQLLSSVPHLHGTRANTRYLSSPNSSPSIASAHLGQARRYFVGASGARMPFASPGAIGRWQKLHTRRDGGRRLISLGPR